MYKLGIPDIESPFYMKRKEAFGYSPDLERNKLNAANNLFHTDGYEVINLLTPGECDQIVKELSEIIDSGDYKVQDRTYHYSDSPRLFEAWKSSPAVLEAARHPKVLERLEQLYGRKPIPFQVINFKKGSNQPFHSDVIHFHTVPERWVVGVWIALEDMDEYNGTLQIIPGSHQWPVYNLQDIGLEHIDPNQPPGILSQKQEEVYRQYEHFIDNLIWAKGVAPKPFLGKKGQALIWPANLCHGGSPIRDPERTRWSQATHYYFEGCSHYYAPMFSNPSRGQYAEKDLKKKDILNHKIVLKDNLKLIKDFE